MDGRADRVGSLVVAVIALVAVLAVGVVGITVSRGDQVTSFGLFLVSGYWQAPVLAALLTVVAAALAVRRTRWAWATVAVGVLASLACFGVSNALDAAAREVNDWIAVEGVASIDGPFTRWYGSDTSAVTTVDVDDASQFLMAAGLLELLAVATAAWSLRARRRATGATAAAASSVTA